MLFDPGCRVGGSAACGWGFEDLLLGLGIR